MCSNPSDIDKSRQQGDNRTINIQGDEDMGYAIGAFILILYVIKSCNNKIDGSRMKKWFGEDEKKK